MAFLAPAPFAGLRLTPGSAAAAAPGLVATRDGRAR